MNQEKWVIVVRRDGDKNNGKVYNNFVTGENLIFTNLEEAEKFALKIETEGRGLWTLVEPYEKHVLTEKAFDDSFVATMKANRESTHV
ncbi:MULTISPECIES: hypothetical protein [Bacillus]|uniref:hypothetical protein n=1 Tax=Bacillus TaxID=1386 RepID=UPI00077E67DD|nr:hypothetical protein [Bacillus subtilis]AMR46905.1 hypothetical protein KHRBS_10780 [Bacillus subtilis subsp. subtilis]AOA54507.1 hypothetical protein BSHJ0_01935 [Bacillus subtilis]AWX22010.1 hypothetical protein CXF51_10865 [Bacillus subtilis subsp. subtilis]AYK63142.1 hypothetical protein D9C14_18080 [Bacillus subtilis subsp. subtilis]MBO3635170.1 hypothetical protein [Bacillus subtilis]